MAVAIRSCLGVDIGSHSIRVALIELGKTGPRVVSLLEEPLKVDPNPALTEAQRHQAVARQLQDMLKRGKVRTKHAVFCIPGQSVFIKRPPKLPKTTPERLDRIIRFEARQQIPFPLDKTLMEYQVFEEGDAAEVNVLLAAIKRDFIMNFMKLVKRTGLNPLAISVSSLALYNFHELNTASRDLLAAFAPKKDEAADKKAPKAKKGGLFGKKKAEEASAKDALAALEDDESAPIEDTFEEVRAYVNLGAALMDLAIPKPGPARLLGFTRSVPLAGNEMDRAIRDRLGLETLDQARRIKESEAAVLSTEFEVEGDPEAVNMEACEAVTAVADRIISELRRSLDYFISQPDGVAVDTLVLSGGLARLPFLRSYIEEKLGIAVELAEPRHQQLRMPEPLPDPFCPFVVSVGLALQGVQMAQNTINFLPEEVKTMLAVRQKPYEMIAMSIMALAVIGLSFNVGSNYAAQFKNEYDEYQINVQKYTQQSDRIAKAEARNGTVKDAFDKLAKTVGMPEFPFFMLNEAVLSKRPPDVVLDDVQIRLDGFLLISGKSTNRSSINKFFEDLKATGYWIFDGKAEFNKPPSPAQDPRFAGQQVYDFTIVARSLCKRARLRTIGTDPGYKAPVLSTGGFGGGMGGFGGGGAIR